MDNNVWTVVDLPPDKKAVGSKWVFRLKKLPDGLAGLFTHVIPYMILVYYFWHFYACHLPLMSQGNWVSFYSTLLLLPFRCFPGFV